MNLHACRARARENRWAHLLSGAPLQEPVLAQAIPNADVSMGEVAALKANVARRDMEVSALKETVARICADLGVPNKAG